MTSNPVVRLVRAAGRRFSTVRADGERGSLVLAMLVTLVATSVAALILPVLVTSTRSTTFDDRRTRQLAAAESGVQTAIARIRGTADDAIGTLPCGDVIGTVLGSVNLRYKVNIQYTNADPNLLDALGRPVAKVLRCATDALGNVLNGVVQTPGFAKITAYGTDVATGDPQAVSHRQVTATYVVKTNNANIVGGLFRTYRVAGKQDLCLTAATTTPAPGASIPLSMQVCDATKDTQKWAYNKTLTVSLVATRVVNAAGVTTSEGWCVDGGAVPYKTATSPFATLVARPCGTASTPPQQMWSMNDNAGMQGTNDGKNLVGVCWAVNVPDTAGSTVVLQGQCSGTNGYENVHSWQPDAAVGAGASGAAYGELVNYKQFGRCLDITNFDTSSAYLIAWVCKQNPDPTQVGWNERWTLPTIGTDGTGTGQIYATDGTGHRWCLKSPLSTASGKYVQVTACTTVTQDTKWTVRTKTDTYATSYRIEDWSGSSAAAGKGYCLQPTDVNAPNPDLSAYGTMIGKMTVAQCSDTTLQKWNAPPNVDAPSVKDQAEN